MSAHTATLATPQHKLIQSYLEGPTTTHPLYYEDKQVGAINGYITIPPAPHKSCYIYLGQAGIIVFINITSEVSSYRCTSTTGTTLLFSDPELKSKLQQVIQRYQNIQKPTPK